MARVSAPDFWENLYARGGDGWELGAPAPPLVDFFGAARLDGTRVAVPGCGRGHDARFLASLGYDAVGFDFSAAALAAARAVAAGERSTARFEARDVFTLGRELPRAFDGVWEYTCFCAIDPARRSEYVASLAGAVRPGGWLLGCFFPLRGNAAGPPFPVSTAEIRRVLRPAFRIERAFPPLRSARGRQGREWLVLARRTGA
jgi:SAM-dependent methyltransferase